MKSEERHRLEQNALADWLGRLMLKVRPYSTLILTAAVVGAVVFGAASWWIRSSAQGNEAAWDNFYTALGNATNSSDPRPLKQLVDRYRGTAVGYWAAVVASEIHLARGTAEILSNRADAIAEIKNAQEGFSLVADECRDPRLRERALYGRGRSYEALAATGDVTGNLARAVGDYEQVLGLNTGSVYAKFAEERLKELRRAPVKDFYQRLAAYQPPAKSPASASSSTGAAAGASTFSESVLNATELKAPAPGESKTRSPVLPATGGQEKSKAEEPQAEKVQPAQPAPAPATPPKPTPHASSVPAEPATAPSTKSPTSPQAPQSAQEPASGQGAKR